MLPVLLMLTAPVNAARGLWGARATGKDAASSAGVNSTTSVPLDAARATGKDAASAHHRGG